MKKSQVLKGKISEKSKSLRAEVASQSGCGQILGQVIAKPWVEADHSLYLEHPW